MKEVDRVLSSNRLRICFQTNKYELTFVTHKGASKSDHLKQPRWLHNIANNILDQKSKQSFISIPEHHFWMSFVDGNLVVSLPTIHTLFL